jgi:ubiquinol-cytochrome c reductase iron-sulfur subunit
MNDTVDKRLLYRALLKLLIVVAAAAAIYVMWGSLFSSDGSDGVEYQVDLSGLAAGRSEVVERGGRRYIIVHRDVAMVRALHNADEGALLKPRSPWDHQPRGVDPVLRSFTPDYFVASDYGTDLNCPLKFDGLLPTADDQGWRGGFRDTCRGSKYDLAGRVLKGQQAQRNLEIPDYRIEGDTLYIRVRK